MLTAAIVLAVGTMATRAQETQAPDSITTATIHAGNTPADSIPADSIPANSISQQIGTALDQQPLPREKGRDWSSWRPNPQRALWLALVFPGGGQIYNRKYWKLPIVYGGFIGCAYAMNWNNNMYKDYSQAFLDISDNDPTTASYNKFLHLGSMVTDANKAYYKEVFQKRKDRYRRWRDLSFFVMVGVYALSVIDAYVDAELSVFDISKDLSLRVEPTVMKTNLSTNPLESSSLGLQCSLNF